MITRFFLVFVTTAFFAGTSFGQGPADALRFSYFDYGGTGRFIGAGSALSPFGTEFSTISTNPAGLAMYRSSEVVISPAFLSTTTSSQLEGAFYPFDGNFYAPEGQPATIDETRSVFNLNNFGFVVQSVPRNPVFKTFNFAIGFNHVANFNQHFLFEGSSIGSIVERWQEFANTYGVDPNNRDFEENVAFEAGALLYNEQDDFYETDYQLTYDNDLLGVPVRKSQLVEAQGSMSELVFSLATNYNELVMFGMTVGVPFVNYQIEKTYEEIDDGAGPDGSVPFFDDLAYEESLTTTGAGVNFKFGAIVRPAQEFRLGVAVHSPTFLSLDDESSFAIGYTFTDIDGTSTGFAESNELLFDYRLNTPWRFLGSAGFLYKKLGFLTAEVEYVDYGSAKFRYNNFPQEEEIANEDVELTLGSVLNIRLGAEIAYDVFRFRAGAGLLPSPFDEGTENDLSLSAGLGVRTQSFFFDFAWKTRSQTVDYIPYTTFEAPQQVISNEVNYNNFVLTLGLRY